MNHVPEFQSCKVCDAIDELYHFTPAGKGPFCQDCWAALNDPDQALLTEGRLAELETELDRLKTLLGGAAGVLARYTSEDSDVVKELRKAAE